MKLCNGLLRMSEGLQTHVVRLTLEIRPNMHCGFLFLKKKQDVKLAIYT